MENMIMNFNYMIQLEQWINKY